MGGEATKNPGSSLRQPPAPEDFDSRNTMLLNVPSFVKALSLPDFICNNLVASQVEPPAGGF